MFFLQSVSHQHLLSNEKKRVIDMKEKKTRNVELYASEYVDITNTFSKQRTFRVREGCAYGKGRAATRRVDSVLRGGGEKEPNRNKEGKSMAII